MNNAAALMLAVVAGVGGYALRWRLQPSKPPPPSTVTMARAVAHDAPEITRDARPSRVPVDCQTCKNQLAICMAYHPSENEKDKQLAMCRGELEARKQHDTLPSCYNYVDFLPTYDRELGEADPSPETLERAQNMTPQTCVSVLTWEMRARLQLNDCLKGETPPGFKEKYASSPPWQRPLVKACLSDALREQALDAVITRDEDRMREMGHKVTLHTHFLPNNRFELVPVSVGSSSSSGGSASPPGQ